ncbi:hypothetical protein GCM10027596_39680 [Nocardioides korecus]
MNTGADLLTDKPKDRRVALLLGDEHVQVEATWGIYQRMVAAYREPDRVMGRALMVKLIESISGGVPKVLCKVITLGRTLKQRTNDVLTYFDRPGASNGPTEAIQRTPRTPPRVSARVPQPDQLHRTIGARVRRLRAPVKPWIVRSRKSP